MDPTTAVERLSRQSSLCRLRGRDIRLRGGTSMVSAKVFVIDPMWRK